MFIDNLFAHALYSGSITGYVTRTSSHSPDSLWYKSLIRPKWEPPRWAFGVVWPLLYLGMGYASHLNVKALDRTPPGFGRARAMRGMKLYYAQLFLNQIWTPLFFGAGEFIHKTRGGSSRSARQSLANFLDLLIPIISGQLSAASANLLALTATIGAWGLTLKDVDERAAYLTVPYFGALVSYSTVSTRC